VSRLFVQSYLDVLSFFMLSFDMSPFDMLSSDFIAPFFVFFFFILVVGSIGLLVFMESWPGGLVVWAEAADTLPTKATQHAAISKFRILISCWNKRPRRMKSTVFGSLSLLLKFVQAAVSGSLR
jgi:hypothetical protein